MPEENKALVVKDNQAESLIAQAIEKGTSVDTMERLLAMRREIKAERAKEEYDGAMSQFQSDCPIIKKTKQVLNKDKTVRYAFAPIDAIVSQVKPTIQKHGFSYTIDAKVEDAWVTAICKVTHSFGHSETSSFKIPIDKDSYMTGPQKFASALTFAKRYAFCNAFGILTGDDDDDTQIVKESEKKVTLFDKAKEMVGQATLEQLKEFKVKVVNSKKYTDPQKKELTALVDQQILSMSS